MVSSCQWWPVSPRICLQGGEGRGRHPPCLQFNTLLTRIGGGWTQPDLDSLMETALSSVSLCPEISSLVPFPWSSVIERTSHYKSLCLGATGMSPELNNGGQGRIPARRTLQKLPFVSQCLWLSPRRAGWGQRSIKGWRPLPTNGCVPFHCSPPQLPSSQGPAEKAPGHRAGLLLAT